MKQENRRTISLAIDAFTSSPEASRGSICRVVTTFMVVTLLSACSGAHRLARQHLENGEYEAAASVYSQILHENPGDAGAADGISRAREGIVSHQLIAIRMARLGGSGRRPGEEYLDSRRRRSSASGCTGKLSAAPLLGFARSMTVSAATHDRRDQLKGTGENS